MQRERWRVEAELAALPGRAVALRARGLEDRLDVPPEVDAVTGAYRRPAGRPGEETRPEKDRQGERRTSTRADPSPHGAQEGCKQAATGGSLPHVCRVSGFPRSHEPFPPVSLIWRARSISQAPSDGSRYDTDAHPASNPCRGG